MIPELAKSDIKSYADPAKSHAKGLNASSGKYILIKYKQGNAVYKSNNGAMGNTGKPCEISYDVIS